jgi:hypothetical protein
LTGNIYLNILEAISLPLRVTNPLTDTNTGSDDNLQLATSWLQECITEHKDCLPYHSEIVNLPTRVIDVSSKDFFLHETAGEIGSYAILSHCWGKHPIITTTKDNIRLRLSKIPSIELSKTFRDAVAVTRALSLQYVWIDSLCIIQDSTQDWELESSKMGNYYAAAEVTIAATDAQDSSIGCFVERNPHSLQPCYLEIQLYGSKCKLSIITTQTANHYAKTGALNRRPERMSLLDSRAWCLQERIMSSRILSFGHLEMDWICNSRRIFEGQIQKGASAWTYNTDCFRTLHDLQKLIATHGAQCKTNIWFDIVEQYTRRNLTYNSDMLPGLSGLANKIQSLTHDEYLAGIWKHDLARDLLWRTPNQLVLKSSRDRKSYYDKRLETPLAKRSAGYRAPSWSWAAIDQGCVNWDHVREFVSLDGEAIVGIDGDADKLAETCFELLGSAVDLQGRNPFGQVRDGSLRVRGFLKRAEVLPWEEDSVEGWYIDDFNLIDPETKMLIGRVDVDVGDLVESPISCLPIIRDVEGEEDFEREFETLCLVLTPVESRQGYFTRIGVAVVKNRGWFAQCGAVDLTII